MNSGIGSVFVYASNQYPKLKWISGSSMVTVKFTGEYTGTQTVYRGEDAVLPVLEETGENIGKMYTFTVNGKAWTGANVTANTTVTVGKADRIYYATFKVNGVVIGAKPFKYGDAKSTVTPPEIPERGGCDGAWEEYGKGDGTM